MYCTGSIPSAVIRVGFHSYRFPTGRSHSKSFNIALLKVMISSTNEHIFIHHLSDLTLQIMINSGWASLIGDLTRPIPWNSSRHAPSWQFYLHFGSEKTGSPGIIIIIWHQLLCHPSEHGTSAIGTNVLARAHIATFDELTELEFTELTCSTVDETALAILKRPWSWGITILSSWRKIIFDMQVDP